MKILICGSRNWEESHMIYVTLAGLRMFQTEDDPLILVHGAARGADSIAKKMADQLGIPNIPYPADWKIYGAAAGPIRNQQMLDENEIAATYAFRLPGKSNGTDDMIRRSKEAWIPTYVITKEI